jgi:hypothetical protein
MYRRQALAISLGRLTIPQLGEFLAQWNAAQRLWTPTRIELTHVRDTTGPGLYDAKTLMTAIYLAGP